MTFNREALAAVCQRRGVDLSNVNVYLDSSKTPLSLITTETFWLGGKHLRIKGSYLLPPSFPPSPLVPRLLPALTVVLVLSKLFITCNSVIDFGGTIAP